MKYTLLVLLTVMMFIGCTDSANTDEKEVVKTDVNNSEKNTTVPTAGFVKTTSTFSVNGSAFMWQDTEEVYTSTATAVWTEADRYCQDLDLEGYTDWRLPLSDEYKNDLFPYKDELTYRWEDYYQKYDAYIFWTGSRLVDSSDSRVSMFNISSASIIIFVEDKIFVQYPTRCIRDITK